jgi:pyruvate/2-oxoglutarate dehydrogenase complex dihydrolipoamide dehydrogenase (E3) component
MSVAPEVYPRDAHNQRLLSFVHPSDWSNPEPAARYDLVVIGAGSGGLISAAIASSLGARVALIEKHLLGGDCLNYGCVPSKTLLAAAHESAEFGDAMERVRAVRAGIAEDDAATRYRDEFGVDVFLGTAAFTGTDTVQVEGASLSFRRAIVATGARPVVPDIPGLADAGCLTNETVFSLTERPARLAVIGAGPIGCELAQAFAGLGTQVTLFHDGPHVLNREDADAAAIVQQALRKAGVHLVLDAAIESASKGPEGRVLRFRTGHSDDVEEIAADEILVGAGRSPNVSGLGLDVAGVDHDERRGIQVDDRLRTTNRRVYAVGDCCMRWKFTHAADAAAKIAVQNALFFGRKRLSKLVMPWVTYTDPEIAHVGLYEHDAAAQGMEIDTYRVDLERVNRAQTDGRTDGFCKIHVRRGRDQIVGATIVGPRAGELISEITVAMTGGLGLAHLASVIHPYPTQAELIRATANAYMRTRLTPRIHALFTRVLTLLRRF